MSLSSPLPPPSPPEITCPDLRPYWQVGRLQNQQKWVLIAKTGQPCYELTPTEAYILQHFTGECTPTQLQTQYQKQFKTPLQDTQLDEIFNKLLQWGILAEEGEEIAEETRENTTPPPPESPLKENVHWIEHPDGYWILRNPEDVTFIQVDGRSKQAIELIGKTSSAQIPNQVGITPAQFGYLMQLMTATAMFKGTKPPKPPKKKFTPLQLLFFKLPLFNPDPYLGTPARWLSWIWTAPFFYTLLAFLGFSLVWGLEAKAEILQMGTTLLMTQRAILIIPFILCVTFVVTLHEFAHALTLKHYGGIVHEMGFLFMLLIPAAYTNTTDSYCLVKRQQRAFVVGGGVLCQIVIAAIAFWLWHFSLNNSEFKTLSYLLMVAGLFTVAVNLNPMVKFDGYHLAVAITGINNLRDRSFLFYRKLFTGKPLEEKPQHYSIFAIYAPFCFLYLIFIFGSIIRLVVYTILDHFTITALLLILAWAIYYFFPRNNN
ncbi:M50 family metallopeptidase [Spirulina subsalsa FACHB-351]|uniref:M50 family metallopeptidase n=2 Tax=Spirulina subsalsa TaxID=54311 RepID=A0ABT3LAT6_9CYAN|nr:M50 family metallopeptidase [Spirulina subsalsa FACHB-351]